MLQAISEDLTFPASNATLLALAQEYQNSDKTGAAAWQLGSHEKVPMNEYYPRHALRERSE